MRIVAWALLLLSSFAVTAGREPERHLIKVSNAGELMELLATPLNDVVVELSPGSYELMPTQGLEPSTNYCGANSALVPASIGLTVSGRNVTLRGPVAGDAIITVNASHGLYVKDCEDCAIERLTVTGLAPNYTSCTAFGAIVVRNSSVLIANCLVRDNISTAQTCGVDVRSSGICGLAGAKLQVEFNDIIGNNCGIDLHAGSRAVVRNNLISGQPVGGVGVSLLCDASVQIERNHIRDTSNGVQISDSADVLCRANIFEDVHASAIIAGGDETLRLTIERNVFYRSSAGIVIGRRTNGRPTGHASSNILVEIGRDGGPPDAPITGAEFETRKNTFYDSKDDRTRDVPREMFWRARRQWTRTYRNTAVGVDGRHKFHESAFLTRYGRWAD